MEINDVANIIHALVTYYPANAPKTTKQMAELVALWNDLIGSYDKQQFEAAVKMYVLNDKKGFFPTPGQIIAMLQPSDYLNEQMAWTLVRKAIGNSAYHSEEEFDKLPAIVQKAVGSHNQLRNWATDNDFNESVIQSLFGRTYNAELSRQKQLDVVPPSIRELTKQTIKMLGGANETI